MIDTCGICYKHFHRVVVVININDSNGRDERWIINCEYNGSSTGGIIWDLAITIFINNQ
jgi:hypothetical protein